MAGALYDYPFWGPLDNGPAHDFSLVSQAIGAPQVKGMLEDSLRLKVPQSDGEEINTYLGFWQYPPVLMGAPQAPVTVPEQFARADSLLAYAMATLGSNTGPQPQTPGGIQT